MGHTDEELELWAGSLGLEIAHADGCPGVVLPGIAVLIDERLPDTLRRQRIEALLRLAGGHVRSS
jgi:hypothetical protein